MPCERDDPSVRDQYRFRFVELVIYTVLLYSSAIFAFLLWFLGKEKRGGGRFGEGEYSEFEKPGGAPKT